MSGTAWKKINKSVPLSMGIYKYVNIDPANDFNKDTKANVFQICHPHSVPRVFDPEG